MQAIADEAQGENVLIVTHGDGVNASVTRIWPWSIAHPVLHTGFTVAVREKEDGKSRPFLTHNVMTSPWLLEPSCQPSNGFVSCLHCTERHAEQSKCAFSDFSQHVWHLSRWSCTRYVLAFKSLTYVTHEHIFVPLVCDRHAVAHTAWYV